MFHHGVQFTNPNGRPAMTPDRSSTGVPDDWRATLMSAAEELARAIADCPGGLPPRQSGPFAVRHLSHLTGLVAAGTRPAFLFACWQQWSAALLPARRVAIARDAGRGAVGAVRMALAATLPAGLDPAWRRYREITAGCVGPGGEMLAPYLIFEQAGHALHRVGLTTDETARAAMLLRSALRPGFAGDAVPASPVTSLQPV